MRVTERMSATRISRRSIQLRLRLAVLLLATVLVLSLTSLPTDAATATGLKAYNDAVAQVAASASLNEVPSDSKPTLAQMGTGIYRWITPPPVKASCIAGHKDTSFNPCVYGSLNSKVKMVLLGDSQASQWAAGFMAYATANNVQLTLLAMNGCPPWLMTFTDVGGTSFPVCDRWHTFIVNKINTMRPNYVVVTGALGEAGNKPTTAGLVKGMNALYKAIAPSKAKVAVLSNVPMYFTAPAAAPATCYSVNKTSLQSCNLTPQVAFRSTSMAGTLRAALQQGATASKVPYINLDPLLCTDAICPSIIGKYLVYHDAFHLTWTFSQNLAKPLGYLVKQAIGAPSP